MRHLPLVAFLLALFAVSTPRAGAQSAQTVFHFTSQAGDYVGAGQERTLSAANGYTFSVQSYGTGIQFNASGSAFFTVLLTAPTGSTLAVGDYPQATRMSSATNPGLDFSGDGRGNNTSTGQFQILELTYDTSGKVATLAANFVQHGGSVVPASFGQIRYNSAIPYQTPTGVAQLGTNNYSVFETAGSLTVTATRQDGSTGPLSVDYSTADGTDLAGRDYQASSGTVSWADGDAADKTFTIPILNSGNPTQGNGTFFINLSGAGTGAQTQATVTIVNDNSSVTYVHFISDAGDYIGQGEERTFSIADEYVITVSRNYDGGVSFSWNNSLYDSDSDDDEYWSLDFAPATGTTFGLGDYENAMRFPFQDSSPGLDISGDGRGSNTLTGNFQVLEAQFDGNGNVLKFAANFVQHSEGAIPALTGQVRYNSTVAPPASPGTVQFSAAAYSVEETAGSATITVNRTGGSGGALSVNYATADGTAISGVNYTPASGTLTWADGDSTPKTFTVPVIDDGVYTANRSLNLALTGGAQGALSRATLTVVNVDPGQPGIIQFSGTNYQAVEGASVVTITVNRTGGSYGAVSVDYATADGTASAGVNYTAASGTLTWADGDSTPKTFTVALLDPVTEAASQTVQLSLSGANVGTLAAATLTITNRNFPPAGAVALSMVDYTANETDGAATITVNRTGGSYGALSINYATVNGTALAGQDYTAAAGTLAWNDGDSSPKFFTVPILDAHVSGGGTRTLKIQLTGAGFGVVSQATLTITDNDAPPVTTVPAVPTVSLVASTVTTRENSGLPGVFTISRTGDTSAPLTVTYKIGGSAGSGRDYVALKGTKKLKAGKASARVQVLPIDTGATGGGKVVVKLTIEPQTGSYAVAGSGTAKVKIVHND